MKHCHKNILKYFFLYLFSTLHLLSAFSFSLLNCFWNSTKNSKSDAFSHKKKKNLDIYFFFLPGSLFYTAGLKFREAGEVFPVIPQCFLLVNTIQSRTSYPEQCRSWQGVSVASIGRPEHAQPVLHTDMNKLHGEQSALAPAQYPAHHLVLSKLTIS